MTGRAYRITRTERSTRSEVPVAVVAGTGGVTSAVTPPPTGVALQSDFSNVQAESWFFYTA